MRVVCPCRHSRSKACSAEATSFPRSRLGVSTTLNVDEVRSGAFGTPAWCVGRLGDRAAERRHLGRGPHRRARGQSPLQACVPRHARTAPSAPLQAKVSPRRHRGCAMRRHVLWMLPLLVIGCGGSGTESATRTDALGNSEWVLTSFTYGPGELVGANW